MRLIDADLFMEKLLSMKRTNKELPLLDDDPEVNNYDVGQEETFDLVIRKLSEQPTVDTRTPMANIVEKLEKELLTSQSAHVGAASGMCGFLASGYSGEISAYKKAINIVKQEMSNGLE